MLDRVDPNSAHSAKAGIQPAANIEIGVADKGERIAYDAH
jgi:hypothetical protein